MHKQPLIQFSEWYAEAQKLPIKEPNFVTLATANSQGAPAARTVLLKHHDERGFVFYGNLVSRKMQHIQENPQAALLFYWIPLERQIRIEGRVEQISDDEANAYFTSRGRGSQIGAWASRQSETMPTPQSLQERLKKYEIQFKDQDVPRPEFWTGMRIIPHRFEFWQAGENRLHDRTCYVLQNNEWTQEKLYP